jgi:hypothetical protein
MILQDRLGVHRTIYDQLHKESVNSRAAVALDLIERGPLAWTRSVARLVMRLYPPEYLIGRCVLKDDELGECKVP